MPQRKGKLSFSPAVPKKVWEYSDAYIELEDGWEIVPILIKGKTPDRDIVAGAERVHMRLRRRLKEKTSG